MIRKNAATAAACAISMGAALSCSHSVPELRTHSVSGLRDSWEASSTNAQCYGIEQDLVKPVSSHHRPEAIQLLERSDFVQLDAASAARLAGLETEYLGQTFTAPTVVKNSIARLERNKARVLSTRVGSWTGADELRLVQLERLEMNSETAGFRPFLVRAVAKNEATGYVSVSWCGDDLSTIHWSLGSEEPKSIRYPIIVFLAKQPARVNVGWGMAR